MKIIESHETFFLCEDGDKRPDEMMINWGSSKRRRRVQPRSTSVNWERTNGGEWQLWTVYISLDFVHAQMPHASTGMHIYHKDGWKMPPPEWLTDLIEQSRPRVAVAA